MPMFSLPKKYLYPFFRVPQFRNYQILHSFMLQSGSGSCKIVSRLINLFVAVIKQCNFMVRCFFAVIAIVITCSLIPLVEKLLRIFLTYSSNTLSCSLCPVIAKLLSIEFLEC